MWITVDKVNQSIVSDIVRDPSLPGRYSISTSSDSPICLFSIECPDAPEVLAAIMQYSIRTKPPMTNWTNWLN